MGKIVAVHSYKGGTGKSIILTNLAAICASRGMDVCLLDLDFRAPSLQDTFKTKSAHRWLNNFLNCDCEIEDVLIDFTQEHATKGRLLVGLANPSMEAVREMTVKDRKREMRALRRLISLRPTLFNDMKIDYAFLDTSPGVSYASLNAVVASDYIIVVVTPDVSDLEGSQRMMRELYDAFDKKTEVLMNKVPAYLLESEDAREKLFKQIKEVFNLIPVGMLPCHCDVLRSSRETIFFLEKPEHPFSKILGEVARKL